MNTRRLSLADKIVLAKKIVTKARALITDAGNPENVSGHRVAVARDGPLQVMMTPFSGGKTGRGDFRYQVEIWQDGIGKVFGACWQPQERWVNEFECFRLIKGDWIARFFGGQRMIPDPVAALGAAVRASGLELAVGAPGAVWW